MNTDITYTKCISFSASAAIHINFLILLVVECQQLDAPSNGKKSQCGRIYMSKCEFECNEGYEMKGNRARQCQADGRWTGVQPECKGERNTTHSS